MEITKYGSKSMKLGFKIFCITAIIILCFILKWYSCFIKENHARKIGELNGKAVFLNEQFDLRYVPFFKKTYFPELYFISLMNGFTLQDSFLLIDENSEFTIVYYNLFHKLNLGQKNRKRTGNDLLVINDTINFNGLKLPDYLKHGDSLTKVVRHLSESILFRHLQIVFKSNGESNNSFIDRIINKRKSNSKVEAFKKLIADKNGVIFYLNCFGVIFQRIDDNFVGSTECIVMYN